MVSEHGNDSVGCFHSFLFRARGSRTKELWSGVGVSPHPVIGEIRPAEATIAGRGPVKAGPESTQFRLDARSADERDHPGATGSRGTRLSRALPICGSSGRGSRENP